MRLTFIFLVLTLCGTLNSWSAEGDFLSVQRRIVDIYESNKDAVVKVFAAFNPKTEDGKALLFVGTGFCISKEGHIITNTNVTNGADRVWIEKNGVAIASEQIGHDPLTNIAIIRLLTLPQDYAFLRLSEMSKPPQIGSILVGITCELGMAPGPTMGLVKGWDTNYGERVLPTVYLRTDIQADGGEGGAPVFDLNGSLVGMMVVALPEIRSSFVLPARAVNRIMDDIILSGEVHYAHFGLQTRQFSEVAHGTRVVVEQLEVDGPAAEAGLRVGDHLTQLGQFEIKTDTDLRVASFLTRPDQFIQVEVERDGETLQLPLKVGIREIPVSDIPDIIETVPDDSTRTSDAAEPILEAEELSELPSTTPETLQAIESSVE